MSKQLNQTINLPATATFHQPISLTHLMKKDFAKQKLRVGKSKPEKANATSTSFKAKTLVVPTQSILKQRQLQVHLSLLQHHSAGARKQAVMELKQTYHLYSNAMSVIIMACAPLITDMDNQVRKSVLELFKEIEPTNLQPCVRDLLLYVQSAMTHIDTGIRSDSTLFLDTLLVKCPDETVRLGFTTLMRVFLPLFGWNIGSESGAVSATLSFGKSATATRARHMGSLLQLLQAGLRPPLSMPEVIFHRDTHKFLIPKVSQAFAGLEAGSGVTEGVDSRRELLETLRPALERGVTNVKREGGEIARLAGQVQACLV